MTKANAKMAPVTFMGTDEPIDMNVAISRITPAVIASAAFVTHVELEVVMASIPPPVTKSDTEATTNAPMTKFLGKFPRFTCIEATIAKKANTRKSVAETKVSPSAV
jgi:hypothetical protein